MNISLVRLEMIKDKSVEYENIQFRNSKDLADIGFKLLGKADREMFLPVEDHLPHIAAFKYYSLTWRRGKERACLYHYNHNDNEE